MKYVMMIIIYYYHLLSFIIILIITLLYNACFIIIIMMLVLYMWETNAINLQSWRVCATHFEWWSYPKVLIRN